MASQEKFRRRLRTIIEEVFEGNVNKAAEEIGFSQPTLHKILSGQIGESKDSTISALAEKFGVSAAWLRGETDLPGPARYVPLNLALLFLYHERRQRPTREWLANFKPQSQHGKEVQAAVQQDIPWENADSLWALVLMEAADSGVWPAQLVRMLRLRLEYETSRLKLAAEQLRIAG
jgi:Helix-turn-helix